MTPPSRYTQALVLAARAHEGQMRKGTGIPYISHPVAVSALVARNGGDEDQQIAALLHDVLEDAGATYQREIEQFGPRVMKIVQGCTDGVPNEAGTKQPWIERKRAYLKHLQEVDEDVLLVSACDKLHNASCIVEDLRAVGPAVFERFSAGREMTLWYYEEMEKIFSTRGVVVSSQFCSVVSVMRQDAEPNVM